MVLGLTAYLDSGKQRQDGQGKDYEFVEELFFQLPYELIDSFSQVQPCAKSSMHTSYYSDHLSSSPTSPSQNFLSQEPKTKDESTNGEPH